MIFTRLSSIAFLLLWVLASAWITSDPRGVSVEITLRENIFSGTVLSVDTVTAFDSVQFKWLKENPNVIHEVGLESFLFARHVVSVGKQFKGNLTTDTIPVLVYVNDMLPLLESNQYIFYCNLVEPTNHSFDGVLLRDIPNLRVTGSATRTRIDNPTERTLLTKALAKASLNK